MKISIITVCKNAENEIERTIQSVLSQTYNNIEYIIVDGASTDGTVRSIKDACKRDLTLNPSPKREGLNLPPFPLGKGLGERSDPIPTLAPKGEGLEITPLSFRKGVGGKVTTPRAKNFSPLTQLHNYTITPNFSIKFITESDKGIYNAMNKGTSLATGDFLLFLNAGDYLISNDTISQVAEIIAKDDAKSDIYFGNIVSESPLSKKRKEFPNRLKCVNKFKFFFWSIPHPAAFIKRELLEKCGYDESFKIAGDYDFFVKSFLQSKATFFHIPLKVAVFVTDGVSSDPQNKKLIKEENLMVIKKYFGSFPAIIYNLTVLFVVLRFFCKIWLKFEKKC
ncbi:MAG: glycosyltransferase family 2 protein [bacterium]